MFATLAKYIGHKVVTAILVLAVGLTGYWFYKHPEHIEDLWHVIKGSLIWLGFAAVLPWALFFLPSWVLRAESNVAAAGLLVGYWAVDIIMALWLAGWHIAGTLTWAIVIVGFLLAGVYNFLVCDFLAERAEAS